MDELLQRKEQIVMNHTQTLTQTNSKILELLSNTLKDKKTSAGVRVKILNFINAAGSGSSGGSIQMDSNSRLELARGFLSNANSMLVTLKEDVGYVSLLKDIDYQLELYRNELESIDQELAIEEDDEKRKKLHKQRTEAKTKAA